MRKIKIAIMTLMMVFMLAGCGEDNNTETSKNTEAATEVATEVTEATTSGTLAVLSDQNGNEGIKEENVTDDQALNSIKNYCHIQNPDLEKIEEEGEYPVYWEIVSSDEKQIVILFRSYTGAEIRYYIDPVSGETYVTEFVSGITTEEEKIDEKFNIRDY